MGQLIEPCDVCEACHKLKKITHIDYCSRQDLCWLLRFVSTRAAFNAIEKAFEREKKGVNNG